MDVLAHKEEVMVQTKSPRHGKRSISTEDVGHRVREVRINRELTQQQLANKSDLSRRMIEEIEAGRKSPSLASLLKLAEALRVNPGTLMQPSRQ